MLINNFSGIKLEFDGLYYGGNYDFWRNDGLFWTFEKSK